MKTYTRIIGAAALLCAPLASAQVVHVGGFMDYSNMALAQRFYHTSDTDEWEHSEPTAEYGSTFNGSTMLFFDAWATNLEFHSGAWLGAGLGPWYYETAMFRDKTDDTKASSTTAVMQAWVGAHFLDDQLRFYTGNFAGNGWNNGYVYEGWQVEHKVSNLAMRGGEDTSFTGVEVLPALLPGFRMIAGFPIAPVGDTYADFNDWKHFISSIKMMAQYRWTLYNITFNAGFRPNSYYIGSVDDDVLAVVGSGHTESLFGEAFAQIDLPSLFYGVQMLFTYDVRWREASVTRFDGSEASQYTTGHLLTYSMRYARIPGWTFTGGLRLGYCDDSYVILNEREVFGTLGIGASHQLAGTPYVIGLNAQFDYMQDTKGSGPGSADTMYSGGWIGFETEYMRTAADPAGGKAGRYMGAYAFPYFQRNFANGNLRLGVELLYTRFAAANTTQAISYRVPLYVTFSY